MPNLKSLFCLLALLVGASVSAEQNSADPNRPPSVVGSRCPTGMIWAMKDGYAQCVWCDPATRPGDDTQSLTCSTGYSGGITQTRSYVCNQATNSWVADSWTTVSNTCAQFDCLGARPGDETQTKPCPSSWDSGQITEKRSYSCGGAAAGWAYVPGQWQQASSTCVSAAVTCDPNAQPAAQQSAGCPSGESGSIAYARDVYCSGTSWQTGGWYETGRSCAAAATCDPNARPAGTQNAACPSGQSGSISQARDVYCSGTTWQYGTWYETGRSCAYAGCGGQNVSWGSCSGTLASANFNDTLTAGNAVAGYSGSSSWYCGSTGWGYSGGTCNPVVSSDDYCLNIAGAQPSVPAGYISNNDGLPNGNCCPSGQTWNGSACSSPDLCPTIPGIQTYGEAVWGSCPTCFQYFDGVQFWTNDNTAAIKKGVCGRLEYVGCFGSYQLIFGADPVCTQTYRFVPF